MLQPGCMYCDSICAHRDSLMIKICDFKQGTLYLFRDQKNLGRCILAAKEHYSDLTEMTPADLHEFWDEVAKVAKAIHRAFHPDKINYASYADVVKHLHIHIVPKYIGGPNWGGPFADDNPKALSDEEYQKIIDTFKKELGK